MLGSFHIMGQSVYVAVVAREDCARLVHEEVTRGHNGHSGRSEHDTRHSMSLEGGLKNSSCPFDSKCNKVALTVITFESNWRYDMED